MMETEIWDDSEAVLLPIRPGNASCFLLSIPYYEEYLNSPAALEMHSQLL